MTIKQYPQFENFHEIDHPLVKHKLSMLRDVNTNKKTFNELVHEITLLLVYEVTRSVPLTTQTIQTPLEEFEAPVIASSKKPVILPILRAGIGMVDAFLSLMPHARVGHIGLYRDESTMQPQEYYFKIPTQSEQRQFYICDPMLATGGSAIATIDELKARKVSKIKFVCLVAAPEGVARLHQAHPDVAIYAANLDRELNQDCYILPGLGDAGDRLFGTK